MPKIFISYRREDSQHQADRLHAILKKHVPDAKRNIFIDVDNIPVGVDFVRHLESQVGQCDVLLALIGPDWLAARNPTTNKRRLDDPGDFVRIEIASALKRGIPVAPVLLDGAPLPTAKDLPEDLKPLVTRNGVEVRRLTFEADAERLVRGLDLKGIARSSRRAAAAPQRHGSTSSRWVAPVVALGALVLMGSGAAVWMLDLGSIRGEARMAAADPSGGVSTATDPAPTTSAPFREPEMVAIPTGSFNMGSPASEVGRSGDEGPQRRVTIGYRFEVGKHEVTWAEWDRCVADGGCVASGLQSAGADEGWGKGSRPVINVSWNDAKTYAAWLSRKTSKSYRLLTEAEWEYAARAGATSAYWWGPSASHAYANYGTDECCSGVASGQDQWINTSPAGSFPANAFGLHDMHGNVYEWVEDCYENSYSVGQPSDGSAFTKGSCSDRVIRGGSWYNIPQSLRSAYRFRFTPENWDNVVGFRLARTLS